MLQAARIDIKSTKARPNAKPASSPATRLASPVPILGNQATLRLQRKCDCGGGPDCHCDSVPDNEKKVGTLHREAAGPGALPAAHAGARRWATRSTRAPKLFSRRATSAPTSHAVALRLRARWRSANPPIPPNWRQRVWWTGCFPPAQRHGHRAGCRRHLSMVGSGPACSAEDGGCRRFFPPLLRQIFGPAGCPRR